MKKALVGALAFSILASNAYAYRINPSISFKKNAGIFKGIKENYNPLAFNLGFEFPLGKIFDYYTITPFFSKVNDNYEAGIDVGLKEMFLQNNNLSPFAQLDAGAIYVSEDFEEHERKENFHFSIKGGLEFITGRDFNITMSAGIDHFSWGKKAFKNLRGNFNADNKGNKGMERYVLSIGIIW